MNDGLLEASEIHITTSGVGDALTIESTDDGATDAPDLILYRNSASPAVNDMIGSVKFRGKDLGGNDVDYVELETKLTDVTDGSEDSKLQVNMLRNGASVELFTIGKSECVINEASTTMDFRVESNSNANMLVVDASADAVGVGTASPDANAALSVEGALSLDEISAPTNTADRGQLYTNADNELHMIDGAGTDTIFLKSGKQTMWIPAAAMYPNTTSGCSALTQVELSNGPELKCLDFDDGATESAQFTVAFPKSWNEGTVTFKAYWCSTATDTDGVSWGLRACGMNDNETINLAFGTQIVVDDANQGAANELMVTAESAAITIAGTPAAEDLTFFQISRIHDDSNDTAAEDARLLGIKLYYTTDAGNDV